MKRVKRTLFRIFFAVEAVIFMGTYLFGAQGIKAMRELTRADDRLNQEIAQLNTEIKGLQDEIMAWQTDSFFKEKVARERLHMARKDELVYYIS